MSDTLNVGNKTHTNPPSSCFSSEPGNWENEFNETSSNNDHSPYPVSDTASISRHRSSDQLTKDAAHHDKTSRTPSTPPVCARTSNSMGEHVLQSESINRGSMGSATGAEMKESPNQSHAGLNGSELYNNSGEQGAADQHGSAEGPWELPPGLAEELTELQETNEALKGLLRRNNGKGLAELHYRLEKTERSLKEKNVALKEERIRHKKTEASFLEYKSQAQMIIHNKDSDIKKLNDMAGSLRAENTSVKERLRESDGIVQIGTTENMRLLQICKQNNITVHAYTDSSIVKTVRQDRVLSAVPSTKKNFLKMSHCAYPNECITVPHNKVPTREDRLSSPMSPLHYNRGSQASSVSGNGCRNDSLSPNSHFTDNSVLVNDSITTPSGDVLYVGQETSWKGLNGVVRYIGTVDELHRGLWVGVEFDEGRGEHSGNILGIHYFTAAPRSSVFCRAEELRPSRVKVSSNLEAVKRDCRVRRTVKGSTPRSTSNKSFASENKSPADHRKSVDNTKEESTPSKADEVVQGSSRRGPPPPSTMKRAISSNYGATNEKKKKTPQGLHQVVELNINKKSTTTDPPEEIRDESHLPDSKKEEECPQEGDIDSISIKPKDDQDEAQKGDGAIQEGSPRTYLQEF